MAYPHRDYVLALKEELWQAFLDALQGNQDISRAWSDWNTGADHAAIAHILNVLEHYFNTFEHIIGWKYPSIKTAELEYSLRTSWQYKLEVREKPKWVWIVETWSEDDFAGKEWTIAFIDRMRQLMWDEPFNIRFAAKPETG